MAGGTPQVINMRIIPIAGYDSMLLSFMGAHAPFFTRNLVILTDDSGRTGIGEMRGGESITSALESYRQFVVGKRIGDWRGIISRIREAAIEPWRNEEMGVKKNLRADRSEVAIEFALLDLLGQFMDLPIASLIGAGKQRDKVQILGYMFYIADKAMTDLPYLPDDNGAANRWFSLRRKPALTVEAVVECAAAAKELYGFKDFKLKGGVMPGETEAATVIALAKAFPDARITIDPNACWRLEEAIRLCREMKPYLAYVEDPCGPVLGYSPRETTAEFKRVVGVPVASNMIVTNWRQLHHAIALNAIDIPLADPHYWGMDGSAKVAQLCHEWGLTWGCHSNSHFDITLAVFAQVAASAPGVINALDTHWIWQDGQQLAKEPLIIRDGCVVLPDRPGLGIELDMNKVEAAHQLYKKLPASERNDAAPMQYLIKGWEFDPYRPCLVR